MSEWMVFAEGGNHVGPVTTELLARGIAAGKVASDARVAKTGTEDFQPFSSIDEITKAVAALSLATDAPDTDASATGVSPRVDAAAAIVSEEPSGVGDPTEVMTREAIREAEAAKAKMSPSKPPPPPPRRPSGPMAAAIPPSKPMVPVAPAASPPSAGKIATALTSVPPAPAAAPISAPPPPVPPAPHAPVVPPPPNTSPMLPSSVPPPSAAAAPAPVVEEPKKEEPKTPAVDPKVALLLPLGIFGGFAFLSLIVIVISLVTKAR